jgi:uncharacterized protein YgbK (DUF1537 family)
VVALKSRTNPVAQAVADSLAACEALLGAGAKQILFKYCSTFDSTAAGNIGPVADALMQRLGAELAIICPAFPANGRSIYQGYLFVGSVPLHESSMKDHPLTPMRDSNLMRLMGAQTKATVGLVDYATVLAGADAVKARFAKLSGEGTRYAVTDALTNDDLMVLGAAVDGHVLLTGGSGIAMGLPQNFVKAGLLEKRAASASLSAPKGRAGIISGSCSTATRGQIKAATAAGYPALKVDPMALVSGAQTAAALAQWALAQPQDKPFLLYSSDDPAEVSAIQDSSAATRRARSSSMLLPRRRDCSPRAASRNCSSLAGRPQAPWCRGSASRRSRSGQRSILACPGHASSMVPTW